LWHLFYVKSHGRANLEKNAWALDGFPLWWAQLNGEQPPPSEQPPELALARAAMPADFSADSVRDWYRSRQRFGDDKVRALAWTGLAALAETHGREACQKFLASMLEPSFSKDARGWLHDALNPMPHRFRVAAGLDLASFVPEWRAAVMKEASKPTAQAAL
ncbi:MAG TPA: hypothetical protein VGH90_09260, partial [Chthoniobacteraceae bacterium]